MRLSILKNSVLNLVSSFLPLAILQFVILPSTAAAMGDSVRYGDMLTIVALFTIGPGVLGNALNNTRLIYNNKYKNPGHIGDFPLLLPVFSLLGSAVVVIVTYVYTGIGVELVLVFLTTIPWFLLDYFIVFYQIKLDYTSLLKLNSIQTLGYVGGYFVFTATGLWPFIYLFGKACPLIFFLVTNRSWREPRKKTPLYRTAAKDAVVIAGSSLLNNIPTYADRLLINPMLGASAVAVYYASSLLGKMLMMAVSPLSSVLLSYLSHSQSKEDSHFWQLLIISTLILTPCGIVLCFVSGPILEALYPSLLDEALRYVPLIIAASLFSALSTLLTPYVLRYFSRMWQVVMNATLAVFYVSSSVILLLLGLGLWGFCISSLATNVLRLAFTVAVYARGTELQ